MNSPLELSGKLGAEAPVVMIQLNVDRRFRIPTWAERVKDYNTEKSPTGEGMPSGRKILECQQVKMSHIMSDLNNQEYVPLRLVVIDRPNGRSIRMVLVCVHKDHVKGEDKRMPRQHESDVRTMLSLYLWDGRVYRNPGENGGNFILGLGGFTTTRNNAAFATLRVNGGREFELTTTISE